MTDVDEKVCEKLMAQIDVQISHLGYHLGKIKFNGFNTVDKSFSLSTETVITNANILSEIFNLKIIIKDELKKELGIRYKNQRGEKKLRDLVRSDIVSSITGVRIHIHHRESVHYDHNAYKFLKFIIVFFNIDSDFLKDISIDYLKLDQYIKAARKIKNKLFNTAIQLFNYLKHYLLFKELIEEKQEKGNQDYGKFKGTLFEWWSYIAIINGFLVNDYVMTISKNGLEITFSDSERKNVLLSREKSISYGNNMEHIEFFNKRRDFLSNYISGYKQDGRIDLYLKSENKTVLIECKFKKKFLETLKESLEQLFNYREMLNKNEKNCELIPFIISKEACKMEKNKFFHYQWNEKYQDICLNDFFEKNILPKLT